MQTDQIRYPGHPDKVALEVWENEGGAPKHANFERLFGRRIETDGSWTVYHASAVCPSAWAIYAWSD